MMVLIKHLFPLLLIANLSNCVEYLEFNSENEAQHCGHTYTMPRAVAKFISSSEHNSPDVALNDFVKHHKLTKTYCKRELCNWKDYYAILRYLRNPFKQLYDPGMDQRGISINSLHIEKGTLLSDMHKCEEISQPTADQFYSYVHANRPFIIRNLAQDWPALEKWNFDYLKRIVKDKKVTVSASPTGDFVGPEPIALWPPLTRQSADKAKDQETHYMTRPGTLSMDFASLVEYYKSHHEAHNERISRNHYNADHDGDGGKRNRNTKKSKKNNRKLHIEGKSEGGDRDRDTTGGEGMDMVESNFLTDNTTIYLEYYPLNALNPTLKKDIKSLKEFAHFLSLNFELMWLGGGNNRKNGRLHFDRHENIMVMIAGKKEWHMYSPLESTNLYGDSILRQASLEARVVNVDEEMRALEKGKGKRKGGGAGVGLGEGTDSESEWHDPYSTLNSTMSKAMSSKAKHAIIFRRLMSNIDDDLRSVSTYTNADPRNSPNYTLHPLLKKVKSITCTIEKGDALYIPSHWWHEVITHDDEEGKSIGINYFFEPFYTQLGYKSRSTNFVYNRFYQHLHDVKGNVLTAEGVKHISNGTELENSYRCHNNENSRAKRSRNRENDDNDEQICFNDDESEIIKAKAN